MAYKILEYIQNTGTQYIDTGFAVTPNNLTNLRFEIDQTIIAGTNVSVSGSGTTKPVFYIGTIDGVIYYGSGAYDNSTNVAYDYTRRTFIIDAKNGKVEVTGLVDKSVTFYATDGSKNLYFFGFNTGNGANIFSAKVYRCKIYDNGALVRDFVPCQNDVGVVGFLDNASGQFYTNAGTGEFIGGPVLVEQPASVTVPDSPSATVAVRVKATDSEGNESAYATGEPLAIGYNSAPVISGTDADLGEMEEAPAYAYTVTDPDTDQVITVTEKVTLPNGKVHTLRTYTATSGAAQAVKWNCHCWLCCLPGTNTLTITATDGVETVARKLTFTKAADCISAARAVATDAMANKVLLSIYPTPATLPADCTIEAQVTNNPFDDNPVWEDVSVCLNRVVHTFANSTCVKGYGVGYRFCIKKGAAEVYFDTATLRFA